MSTGSVKKTHEIIAGAIDVSLILHPELEDCFDTPIDKDNYFQRDTQNARNYLTELKKVNPNLATVMTDIAAIAVVEWLKKS